MLISSPPLPPWAEQPPGHSHGSPLDSASHLPILDGVRFTFLVALVLALVLPAGAGSRPSILLCISDDQSYAHTGANGDQVIRTPAFDRIAREGLRFVHAFCDAPTCGPSRSALLTGQPIWRLEEAGNIHSTLPAKFLTYAELLQKSGYATGFTGKGWSPGRLAVGGRDANPAGKEYRQKKLRPPFRSMSNNDYAANFEDFLAQVQEEQPFCFWLGTHEPHRAFESGAGKRSGKDPALVAVPPIFPDHPTVRNDLLDYYVEVEHFDLMIARAVAALERAGRLDNTLIVITSDHGMPFPRAKASLYDAGTRVPLAIRWPGGIVEPGRVYDGLVNLSDLAPTFLEAAGVAVPEMMTASSLMDVLKNKPSRTASSAFIAMERHDGCRRGGKGYPCRAIRTAEYLYIRNFEPSRWPAGNPDREFCARYIPFGEVDTSPTKTLLMNNKGKPGFHRFYELAFARRPAEELYHVTKDPGQLDNLAGNPRHAEIQKNLAARLQAHLARTRDPRALGLDAPWDYYPYYGLRRNKKWQVEPRP